eukprot:TRINITY_DN9328_c0_g1_i1.p1 TRINITY_DN9328_c0_g1~~TRINITY_DN9328_c0_g1_i1.p1  ORF type:complete len:158 (+),score=4.84 TRINITY_DN9328_c0_g1_i1:107-580(+)
MSALAGWIRFWLIASTVICTYDALFIFNRPDSLNWAIYSGYRTWYTKIDKGYAVESYSFGLTQSYLNTFECFWNVMAVTATNPSHALLFAFATSVMTFAKTIMYMIDGYLDGQTSHNGLFDGTCFVCLSMIWVIVPFAVIKSTFHTMCKKMQASKSE